ncbi:D-arabinono-1,4-lactone oxidase [Hydrogenimonas thermophila]|uniref:D-arabinono-1,4-lactone oxidase n=1 Tax=Hydrogenimonas thermophila TaxID=223786 RepID=UPI00293727D1|nr:D-arabinono-1,4-lactone oxidase [Hydrogenimonas thermophila]WOE70860.1 D-arabinono-1,4-lactone oxidase [Hydrogenimonas thermophila]WOE73378.1 D-arabinono-1,4-lactone oxidase [Hydrogenimonas thermophila]
MKKFVNWARTTICKPKDIVYPETEEEIIELVKLCNASKTPIKVVGAGHSYNDIFCPGENGVLVSLKKFNALEKVDKEKHQVTFQAGMRMPRLIKLLKKEGLSISNLGTNVFDNVAGSCATGYHGSGINYRIFSNFVTKFEIITPTGEKKVITKDDPEYDIYAVSLGMLGIVIRITLQCEPYFKLKVVEKKMSFEAIEAEFETLLKENDHFKFIWIPHTRDFMVWTANRTEEPANGWWKMFKTYFVSGVLINNFLHELLLFFASFNRRLIPKINRLMSRLLLPEKNVSVYPSHWAFFLPHVLKQDVVEYAFNIKDTFKVFREIIEMIEEKKIYVDAPIEVRFVKGDTFWMSPTQGEDTCWIGTKIHFPLGREPEYFRYFSEVDRILLKYRGRPHWGKQFRITTEEFKQNYPKWDEFWAFVEKNDPNGIFTNRFVKRLKGEA